MRTALALVAAMAPALPAVVLAQEAPEAASTRFACADGRVLDVAFPDAATAIISVDDAEPVGLALIPPGDVAAGETAETAEAEEEVAEAGAVDRPRYAGNGLQWIADGTASGTLSAEGDPSDPGVACTAEPATE